MSERCARCTNPAVRMLAGEGRCWEHWAGKKPPQLGRIELPQASEPVFEGNPGCYDFCFALKLCRLACGLSQREMANKIGVPRTYISKCENGISEPRIWAVKRSMEAVGFTIVEFAAIAQIVGEQLPA